MRRPAIAIGVVVSALAAARCSTYSATDPNNSGDAGDGAAQSETDAPLTVPPDVDPDGGAADATTRDGDPSRDGASCNACDCDKDGFKNASCEKDAAGVDCDDLDPLVHPGQGFVASSWDTTSPHLPAGDWNCDGVVTKQFPYNTTCSGLVATGCSVAGFTTNPNCGEAATYITCQQAGLGCVVGTSQIQTQGCR